MLQVFRVLSETGVKVERFVPRTRYDPVNCVALFDSGVGPELASRSILALFPMLQPCPIIARSIETSLPILPFRRLLLILWSSFVRNCVLERDFRCRSSSLTSSGVFFQDCSRLDLDVLPSEVSYIDSHAGPSIWSIGQS